MHDTIFLKFYILNFINQGADINHFIALAQQFLKIYNLIILIPICL